MGLLSRIRCRKARMDSLLLYTWGACNIVHYLIRSGRNGIKGYLAMGKKNSEDKDSVLASLKVGTAEVMLHPLGTWIKLSHMRNAQGPVFPGANTKFEKFKM